MAAAMGFGNWQQALDEIIGNWESKKTELFKTFQELKNTESRLTFIFKHNLMRDIDWLPTYFDACDSWHGKSKVEAAFWKAKGNKLFQQRKFTLAVDAYTQSCINAPSADGDDLSLSLGNRSAALFHLTHYKSCVTDIDRAVALNFPPSSLHKLLARKIMALMKLEQRDEAVKSLQVLKQFIESSSFSLKDQKKDEFLKEVAIMEQSLQTVVKESKWTKDGRCLGVDTPKVFRSPSKIMPQASQCVTLSYTPEKGRYLCANKNIPRGSTVITERPFAAVLLPNHYETHCHHCFLPLPLTCIGCKQCTAVKFCDETCRDSAWSEYHVIECRYLDLLHSVGIAHLSLRVVICARLSFLLDFLDHQSKYRLSEDVSCLGLNPNNQYDHGYLTVFDLMTHEDSTDGSDMLQYSLTAGLLLLTLIHCGFFSTPDETGDSAEKNAYTFDMAVGKKAVPMGGMCLPPHMAKIGGLLLRHILQLVCNAHAITSIQTESSPDTREDVDAEGNVRSTEQTRVATAIYPTASLMNHSCDPTIVSSFIGKTLVVRTLKDVSDGDDIFNCYGPHYCRMDKEERQAVLQSQYHFTCNCSSCSAGGFDQRRFCAYKCPRCAGMLCIKTCLECGRTADNATLTRLKSRAAQCKTLFDNAHDLMKAQQYQAAITKLKQCLNQRHEILYKDHRDLALVEDALACCYASEGDFCMAADHLFSSVEFARLLYGPLSQEYGHELHKLAEVLFNAGRLRECADICESCLRVLSDLYHPGHQVLREVKELHVTVQMALLPQMKTG